MSSPRPAVQLHSLVCHAAVDMARRGFSSLARCSDRSLQFVVHDDGSLQSVDLDRLRNAIGDFTFVDRPIADEQVGSLLAKFPISREFRRRNPLALKLLDIPLLATGDVACCDTDVLALRPFSRVFDWPDSGTTGIFMPDSQNAYAMRPWHMVGPNAVPLPMCVNTGLMMFRASHHDLEFIEWFLGREFPVYQRLPGWVEQTCWAALARRGRCQIYDEAQVRVVRDAQCLSDPALVIAHFTSNVRNLWDRAPVGPEGDEAVAVRTHGARRLTPGRLAAEQARRAARRSWAWIGGHGFS